MVTQQLLFRFVVEKKFFPLKTLNDRISSFAYGSDAKNKPSVIDPNHLTGNLKQSGIYAFTCMRVTLSGLTFHT